jgi:hypothetical protein
VTKPITVKFVASASPVSIFDVLIDTQDGQGFVPHTELGLEAGLGFGVTPASIVGASSPFHTVTHELIELGVPVVVPAGFSTNGPFKSGGQGGNGGNGSSPDPAYWSSAFTDNSGDPPASGGLFAIHPDGTTGIVPHPVPSIPPRPKLTLLSSSGNSVKVTWPQVAMGFTLQSSPGLGVSANWQSVTPSPIVSNLQNVVTAPVSGKQFYRLYMSLTNH